MLGRMASSVVGKPLAMLSSDDVNPLSGNIENFSGDRRAETLIGVLSLGVGGPSRIEASLAKEGIPITAKGLALVEENLSTFMQFEENGAMLARLRGFFERGETATGPDANFYLHEIAEGTMRARGMTYESAHSAALGKYGVTEYDLYHPDVVDALPGSFNNSWRTYWGL
jgi:filamentous hemagglutinin